ncbi:methylated-DNA--[protein]-cysteine S-methyltransferase [Oxyplasma meridianum]|uniref:methylated-DNA--[protein]-cysteine S-methyltransferase n=1 Tax=Oxyplasma meridianum TaxID=3073602 RepID=A0AAX4NFF1_9ARCH
MKDFKEVKTVQTVRYSSGKTKFGNVLVIFTEQGICGVTLMGSKDSIHNYLKKMYPDAIIEKDEGNHQYIGGIVKAIDGSHQDFTFDIHGTEFQMKVWDAISKIPYGSTMTYSQIAEKIGRPKAVRSVANACGKNPVPIIIPCHRVIRKSGDLGGYGLGIHVKKQLLDHEKSLMEM